MAWGCGDKHAPSPQGDRPALDQRTAFSDPGSGRSEQCAPLEWLKLAHYTVRGLVSYEKRWRCVGAHLAHVRRPARIVWTQAPVASELGRVMVVAMVLVMATLVHSGSSADRNCKFYQRQVQDSV